MTHALPVVPNLRVQPFVLEVPETEWIDTSAFHKAAESIAKFLPVAFRVTGINSVSSKMREDLAFTLRRFADMIDPAVQFRTDFFRSCVAEVGFENAPSLAADDARAFRTVERTYALREPNRVFKFLESNPYLLPLLVEVPSVVDGVFGDGTSLALKVACYGLPGLDDELEVLVLTQSSAEGALDRLRTLDDTWMLKHDEQADGKLSFHIEYV